MTNWQLIATLATLIIAIFGANWSGQRNLEKLIEAFRKEVDAKLELLRGEMKQQNELIRAEIKAEIAGMKAEQTIISHRLEVIEQRFRPAA